MQRPKTKRRNSFPPELAKTPKPLGMKKAKKSVEENGGKLRGADRSAYFARREAAKVLRVVLEGDAKRRASASIKSLIYQPSVRNKKATFALLCETLKHLPIIKDVLEAASILNTKWKRQQELVYIIVYDILFGQAVPLVGDAEKYLMRHEGALRSALKQLLSQRNVKTVKQLIALHEVPDVSVPRYVRVNTLKLDVDSALFELQKNYSVQKDNLLPELLILPPGTDLHDHPLVKNGSIFMQGKASSMAAPALRPQPGWEVIDACAAPGNKTIHLAALMMSRGKIIACELKKERVKRLKDTIKLSGASNIQVLNEDFLNINPKDPSYSKVNAILLDPSCSGSGTAASRLDHLLPSRTAGQDTDMERLNKLASFQRKALQHALLFPALERIVYSTCSINQIENEDVIKSVLPIAESHGFHLAKPFPEWQCRGLPVFEGSECLIRTDPAKHGEGFFIALFARKDAISSECSNKNKTTILHSTPGIKDEQRKKKRIPFISIRRDRLNEQFVELGNVLDPDRPKNDKATILGDTIQLLKDLTSQVSKLKEEYATLNEESRELTQEKNDLREEKASLKSDIENLNNQYQQQLRTMFPWTAMDHSVVMAPPSYPFPMPMAVPPGPIPMQPFPYFANQHPAVISNPHSTFVPYLAPNTIVEQQSTQYVSPPLHPGSRSNVSEKQESKSKSFRESKAEKNEDSNDVTTDLQLKTPGSSGDQDLSSGQRKSGKLSRRESSCCSGGNSLGRSSSHSAQDSSSSSTVASRKHNE